MDRNEELDNMWELCSNKGDDVNERIPMNDNTE